MAKTIVIVGYGSGVSAAVAENFGAEGFAVAAVARNRERIEAGVAQLQAKAITAKAFVADAGDPAAIGAALAGVREQLGGIHVLHWNAYANVAPDLLTADTAAVHAALDVASVGLLAAVRAVLPDLKAAKDGAVLITNGGFGYAEPQADAACVTYKSMGLGLANAVKHKLVGLLAERLRADGIFVGEVMIEGTVKGTAWEAPNALEPSQVASAFWKLYRERTQMRARVS